MARRSRWAVLAGAVMALSAFHVGAALVLNCDNFAYQEDAQAYLNANPADPERLDADHDGIACESRPHRPAATILTVPTTTAPTTTATAPAAPANQTRIISISPPPPPTTVAPQTFAPGLLERTG